MSIKPDKSPPGLIPPHGGYRELKSYHNAEIVYDGAVAFCDRFIDRFSRTHDQMVQAARSELKLVGVARASLEELLLDFEDFLRQRKLDLWAKDHPMAQEVRKLVYSDKRSYKTYKPYIEDAPPEIAANAMICLINQTNYLLDQQLRQLEQQFLNEGGFTEKLYRTRLEARKKR